MSKQADRAYVQSVVDGHDRALDNLRREWAENAHQEQHDAAQRMAALERDTRAYLAQLANGDDSDEGPKTPLPARDASSGIAAVAAGPVEAQTDDADRIARMSMAEFQAERARLIRATGNNHGLFDQPTKGK